MKRYGIGKKSKMNHWDSNVCNCELCNSDNRDAKRKERNKNKISINQIENEDVR